MSIAFVGSLLFVTHFLDEGQEGLLSFVTLGHTRLMLRAY